MSNISLESVYSSLVKEFKDMVVSLADFDQAHQTDSILNDTDEDVVLLKETLIVSTEPKTSEKISDAVSRVYSRGPSGADVIKAIMNMRQRTIMEKQIEILKYKLITKTGINNVVQN
jgi:hypothetical protein